MSKVWRRNWTKAARRYSEADVIVVSLGKSGRTWLRVFLYAYFCRAEKREFTLKAEELAGAKIPKMIFTHDLWGYRTARKLEDRLRGRQLIPAPQSRNKAILLLVRDPRDVVVSLFFQVTKRSGSYGGSMSEMIRDRKFGIDSMVDVMNAWMEEWGARQIFKMLRYEDCRRDTAAVFRGVLGFMGVQRVDESAFVHGLEFSSFDNMKKLEAARQFNAGILSPGNVDDPESYKTRRGVVGGFKDYLNAEDLLYVERAIARLDRRYGYRDAIKSGSTGVVS
jgi:hypothetical protein